MFYNLLSICSFYTTMERVSNALRALDLFLQM